jgi:hypothetical protein
MSEHIKALLALRRQAEQRNDTVAIREIDGQLELIARNAGSPAKRAVKRTRVPAEAR